MNVTALKVLISFWNCTIHTLLIKTGELGYSLICGLLTYGERYDEHIPPNDFMEKDSLLAELIIVHKSIIQASHTTHNKNYYGYDSWADEFVGMGDRRNKHPRAATSLIL